MAVPQSMSYANIAGLQFVYGPRSCLAGAARPCRVVPNGLQRSLRQEGPAGANNRSWQQTLVAEDGTIHIEIRIIKSLSQKLKEKDAFLS